MASKKPSLRTKGVSAPDDNTFHLMFEGHSAVMLLIDPQTGSILDANQAALDFCRFKTANLQDVNREINALPSEQVAANFKKHLTRSGTSFFSTQTSKRGRAYCGGTFISHRIA